MAAEREVPFFITEEPKSRKKNPSNRAPRYKVSLVKEAGSLYVTSKPIKTAGMIYNQLDALFEEIDREAFYIVCLDAASKIIGINLVSLGTLMASLVHPREVFKAAILLNAASIIGVHNHPSGSANPSVQDRELTSRLKKAGELLGIFLRDHIIVGDGEYYSFAETGVLEYH